MKRKLIVCFFLLLLLTLQYSCREGNSNNRIQEVEETRSRTCSPNSSTSFLENYNFDLETNDAILISTDEFGTEFRDNAFINLRFIYRNGKLIIYNNRTVLYNRDVNSSLKSVENIYSSCSRSTKYFLSVDNVNNSKVLEIISSHSFDDYYRHSDSNSKIVYWISKNKKYEVDFSSVYGEVSLVQDNVSRTLISGGRGSKTYDELKKMFK